MQMSDFYSGLRDSVGDRPLLVVLGVCVLILLLDLVRQLSSGALPARNLAIFLKNGIVLGLIVGLAGVGLSMIYSILGFANFAHGDYLTTGAFAGWMTSYMIAGFGAFGLGDLFLIGIAGDATTVGVGAGVATTPIAILAGLLVAIVFTVFLSVAIDRLIYSRLRDEEGITLVFTSLGVALVLRYLIAFVWGQNSTGLTSTAEPKFSVSSIGLQINAHEITVAVCSLLLMFAVHYLLQYTKLGIAMRAMADNRDLASVTGIPTDRIVRSTWVIGGGLTGAAGYLMTLESGTLAFNTGWTLLLLIFAAVILGGIGSIYGAIFGGLLIGVASTVSLVWLPSGFTQAAAFALMIVVLIVRPNGLFGGVTTA